MDTITMNIDEYERKLEEARHAGYNLARLEHRRGEKNAYDLGYKEGYSNGYNTAAQRKPADPKFYSISRSK